MAEAKVESLPLDVEKAETSGLQSNSQLGKEQDQKRPSPKGEDGVTHINNEEKESRLPFSKARCIALVATVTGAGFLNTLSLQSSVLILPSISDEVGIPESRQQWVISAYNLAFGCFLLIWGRIADIYGKRSIFILGSALVVPVTALNPILKNEIAFDLFRGLQGFGAAANVPTAIGILGVTFPPGKAKNYAFSAYSTGAPLGAVLGNLFSGIVASYSSWKWVFWVLAILAGMVTVAGIFVIPASAQNPNPELSLSKSVDWIGGILITVGLMSLLFALTDGNVVGWSTPWIAMLIVISFLLIFIFVTWQWYQEKHTERAPLMKISMFKNSLFSTAMILMAISFGVMSNYLIFATYLWQDYQGLSPLQTMLRFMPGGLCGIIVAVVVSRLISRVRTYMILVIGEISLALACLLMAIPIPTSTSYFAYGFIAMILSVIGADTAWTCLTLFTSKCLPEEDQALGGALINASGQIGRSIALAIGTAIQTAVMAHERGVSVSEVGKTRVGDPASLKGIRAANWFDFALALCCVVLCAASFRGTGIVGKIPDRPRLDHVEQGILRANEKDKA